MTSKKPSPAQSEKETAVEALVYRLTQAGYGGNVEERDTFAREYVDMMWARGLRVVPVGRPEAWKETTGDPAKPEARTRAAEAARAALTRPKPAARPAPPGAA